jgi:signal transduction histidine kinase
MLRRMLPSLAVAAAGLLTLAAGLGALEHVLILERDDARSGLAARREALALYAGAAFRDALHARLEAASSRIRRAKDDYLQPAGDLFLAEDGDQLLPRLATPRPGDAAPARALFLAARDGGLEVPSDDSPGSEEIRLAMQLRDATVRGERAAIETSFRALLAHRAGFVVPPAQDLPLMLGVLDHFAGHVKPDARLMSAVLRTGLTDPHAGRLEGLQPALLRARPQFSAADFNFLADRIRDLSGTAQVAHDDFDARVAEAVQPRIDDSRVSGPSVVGDWYVEPGDEHTKRGVRVQRSEVVRDVAREMLSRGLIREGDRLEIPPPSHDPVLLASLSLAVLSPEWDRAAKAIDRRFALKTGLVALCGLLAIGVIGLGLMEQARRHRYLQLKSDFVAAVSHELKTPLASLRVMAETLERRVTDAPGVRDYPARMLRDIDQLIFLVENILSFNRLDRGRWTPRLGEVALADLIQSVREEAAVCARRPVTIHADGMDGARVQADPEMLRLLFTNLTRNACQYNEREPVEIQVEAAQTDRMRVRFRDNGIGVADREREQIFEEFYRGTSSGKATRGSGLGLALCRRIMRLHQGSIRVAESGPAGTTFELTFG